MTKDEIKASVTAADVLQRYGVEVRRGRCRGFCHDGKDYNAQVYGDAVHCFVCHRTMDVFDIVMHFECCDFSEAKRKLDPGTQSFVDRIRAREIAKKRKADEAKRIEADTKAVDAQCEYLRLMRQRDECRPRSPDDPPSQEFLDALAGLSAAEMRYEDTI